MSAFFSYEERLHLQSYLKEGLSFKEISRRLGKDPSTISREVVSIVLKLQQAIQVRLIIPVKIVKLVTVEESVVKPVLGELFTVNTVQSMQSKLS